ncbi:Hypothetical predicted protein [Octopus vulgaris]|uniref:Uncharacterized protein n=1 Tax=Octopus vulgaris TaxID=6645 RepID=A0AA36BFW0_OCTVU|nr:Hypothetical predicted protein [Octopus vulgaris]
MSYEVFPNIACKMITESAALLEHQAPKLCWSVKDDLHRGAGEITRHQVDRKRNITSISISSIFTILPCGRARILKHPSMLIILQLLLISQLLLLLIIIPTAKKKNKYHDSDDNENDYEWEDYDDEQKGDVRDEEDLQQYMNTNEDTVVMSCPAPF